LAVRRDRGGKGEGEDRLVAWIGTVGVFPAERGAHVGPVGEPRGAELGPSPVVAAVAVGARADAAAAVLLPREGAVAGLEGVPVRVEPERGLRDVGAIGPGEARGAGDVSPRGVVPDVDDVARGPVTERRADAAPGGIEARRRGSDADQQRE